MYLESVWLETPYDVNSTAGTTVYLRADTITSFGIIKVNVSLGVDKWIILANGLQLAGDYSDPQDALDAINALTHGKTVAEYLS